LVVSDTVKLGGGSVMIWACMAWQGVGYATNIDGTINGYLFLQSLMDELLNTLQYRGLNPPSISLHQDKDSKHTCRKVKEWLVEQDFETMVWPAQSPNLNLIEHFEVISKGGWQSRNPLQMGFMSCGKTLGGVGEDTSVGVSEVD
jgi:hypothetical protein